MDLIDIKTRVKNGYGISDAEAAFLLRNDPESLAAFMVNNNPGSVNLALRKLGYDHLGFVPDKVALARQLDMILKRKDVDSWIAVAKNWQMNTSGLSDSFLQSFYTQFSN